MSQKNDRRTLPVAPVNLILATGITLAGIAQIIAGNRALASALFTIAVLSLAAALYARRADSKDITRVNALEYRDERDRIIARRGFSGVGASALLLTVAEILGSSILAPEHTWLSALQMIVLCTVWAIANHTAASRT